MNNFISNLKKLFESFSIDTANGTEYLNGCIPKPLFDRAEKIYAPLEKSYEGQLKVLEDAKSGNQDAMVYLYKRYLGLTVNAFKSILGWSVKSGDNHIVKEFASRAMELLSGGRRRDGDGTIIITGPHKTWSAEKYPHLTASSNYLNYFGKYYDWYLREEAKKIYREEANAGGSGTTNELAIEKEFDKGEDMQAPSGPSLVSYDAYFSNDKDIATEDFSDDVDTEVTLEAFENWLKEHKNKTYQEIFKGIKNGTPIKQIAEDLGISNPQMVRNYSKKLMDWAMEFYKN